MKKLIFAAVLLASACTPRTDDTVERMKMQNYYDSVRLDMLEREAAKL